MINATIRFFYETNNERILYVYTIQLNSKFFTSAFVESANIVNFLQIANCDILDITLNECPIL